MSDSIKDGGPAFPLHLHMQGAEGMTLRDWIAGMALQGNLAANAPGYEYTGPDKHDKAAREAYHHADAMLAARERKETP